MYSPYFVLLVKSITSLGAHHPQGVVRPEGLGKFKKSFTASGLKLETSAF
jgi:hypothetical protein